MNTHELLKTLIEKGWVELSFSRFTEKIGQSAELYYSYDIPVEISLTSVILKGTIHSN